MGRDNMLPGSAILRKLNKKKAPTGAMAVVSLLATAGLTLGLNQSAVGTLIAFGTGGFFIIYLIVVASALYARITGRWNADAGAFKLGKLGLVINVIALGWLLFETVNIAWPREEFAPVGAPFIQVWAVIVVFSVAAVLGIIYMVWKKPQARIAQSAALAASINVPLVMTEFNAGLGVPGYDGPFAGAAVFHQHLASQAVGNLDTLSFWTFSDVFEEQGLISSPYYEASPKFGIQTLFGVPKPSYRAFEFIAQQPQMAVPLTPYKDSGSAGGKVVQRKAGLTIGTIDAMVSVTEKGQFTHVEGIFGNYNMSWQPIQTQTVEVYFATPANAIVPDVGTLEIIDSTHAYAMPVWLAAGSPTYPTQKEVGEELTASQVTAEAQALHHISSTEVMVKFTMEAYAVVRVRFNYQMP